jgi:hypothetical protein
MRTLEAEWRQVLRGSVGIGAREDEPKYWERLGCWISPCYGPFSLGARFEAYKLFISLIFKFFSGRGKPRTLDQRIRGHDSDGTTATHPTRLASSNKLHIRIFHNE